LSSSELCACGDNESVSYIVESCQLDGDGHRLHSADTLMPLCMLAAMH